jgi:hypothetical protein
LAVTANSVSLKVESSFYRDTRIVRVFASRLTVHCRLHFVRKHVQPVIVRTKIVAKGIADFGADRRELEVLLQRKYLWANDTERLHALAARFGLKVEMQHVDLTSGAAQPFSLP